MRRRDSILIGAITLVMSTAPARAGPCSHAIVRTQIQVDARIAASPNAGRFPESADARLHHQPTMSSIAAAQRQLNKDSGGGIAIAALALAREADHEGNSVVCSQALAAARQAIGRPER